jgi:hypothetical protein
MLPLIVSLVCVISDMPAVVVLKEAGRYGIGFPITLSGLRRRSAAVDDAPTMNPVVPAATGVFTHSLVKRASGRRLDEQAGTAVPPCVVPLPAAAHSYVTQVALRDIDGDSSAAVGHVMPQDPADVGVVHGLDQREAGHVLRHVRAA